MGIWWPGSTGSPAWKRYETGSESYSQCEEERGRGTVSYTHLVAQFRRLLVAVESFLLVFRHPAPLFVVDCQLEQCLGVSFPSSLLKGFYVDGIGGDGVFLLAVVVGCLLYTSSVPGEVISFPLKRISPEVGSSSRFRPVSYTHLMRVAVLNCDSTRSMITLPVWMDARGAKAPSLAQSVYFGDVQNLSLIHI